MNIKKDGSISLISFYVFYLIIKDIIFRISELCYLTDLFSEIKNVSMVVLYLNKYIKSIVFMVNGISIVKVWILKIKIK